MFMVTSISRIDLFILLINPGCDRFYLINVTLGAVLTGITKIVRIRLELTNICWSFSSLLLTHIQSSLSAHSHHILFSFVISGLYDQILPKWFHINYLPLWLTFCRRYSTLITRFNSVGICYNRSSGGKIRSSWLEFVENRIHRCWDLVLLL